MREIVATRRFEKDFQRVPPAVRIKTERIIQFLKKDPFPQHLNIKKLKGFEGFWRVKIDRNWRLIYTITPVMIELRRIKHRQEIYRLEF